MLPGNTPALFSGAALFGNDNLTFSLLHFNGANGSTAVSDVNAAGQPRTWTALNGAALSTNTSKFGGSSLLLGGSTQCVGQTVGTVSMLNGPGDFTYDLWLDCGGAMGTRRAFFGIQDAGGGNGHIQLEVNTSNILEAKVFTGATTWTTVLGATPLTLNTWYHVAFVRYNNTLQWYLNGIKDGPAVGFAVQPNPSSGGCFIGRPGDYNAFYFVGYLNEFRWSYGARWTNNFVPPNAPYVGGGNGSDSFTKLLLHMDGVNIGASFPDSSPANKTVTVNDQYRTFTTNKKFGMAAGGPNSPASGLYIVHATGDPDFIFGTADFTIDFWMNQTSGGGGYNMIYDNRPPTTQGAGYFTIYVNPSNKIAFGNNAVERITSATTVSIGTSTWFHVAVVRFSGVTKLYVNGVNEGAAYADTNNYLGTQNRPIIGNDSYGPFTSYFVGFLDEFRVSKGIARWTANFAPPGAPYW